ncbi:DUF2231 domain-containing protein [Microbacterium sp. zg.B48]|uniref:DUF2231 domain-containing protein n=1 Tax=unclassified Microbacterium TaxID=2609290 RepID=UPI00214AA76F|nr:MULTISPECIES: DUF2231 domain-containing protein [unclassified Microbacterium]MCR2763108.1 DUF2231 domain-containing protein [Microbacterium sp. zg.B48]MCR2808697.1 DUF2231 domain-containing protein [Microbacterium sp. zg.B185]WIM18871.1 DUF2231 domain-containing protein [Microbacterium sp. zg-B185]
MDPNTRTQTKHPRTAVAGPYGHPFHPILVTIGVGVSGWLGGKLAYTYGVRVAEEKTQAEGLR